MTILTIKTAEQADDLMEKIRESAAQANDWLKNHRGDPLTMLREIKFEPVGFHPTEKRSLNFIEQINQTWSYIAAIAAVRQLIAMHPEASGFNVSPGAHKALELDIMSIEPNHVGAEVFAAVSLTNNAKLKKDLKKLSNRPEPHRYVFFISPSHRGLRRRQEHEKDGIQVWSVDF